MAETRVTAKHSGMGAIPTSEGVTFRVWAPHAEKVYVIGSFNEWKETATPLVSEKNGYWSIDVPDVKKGDEYRYLLHGPAGPFSRIDPYARKVTNAAGNGIIYEAQAFDWVTGVIKPSPWPQGMSSSSMKCMSAPLM
jgi:1,4-alpha-glucan branching enzyme